MKRQNPFTIGISVAEPSDMNLWGISTVHVKDAMVELARYSLGLGYAVSYGGDLEYKNFINFPELLREIVLKYNTDENGVISKKTVTNYLAWHLSQRTNEEVKASFSKFMTLIEVGAPEGVDSKSQKTIGKVEKARSLSKMREVMNQHIDARVLLAGKITDFSGFYPGLVEEAYMALKSKKPLYLLGGFGGCTHKIVELIEKRKPKELTLEYQTSQDESKKELIDQFNKYARSNIKNKIAPVDYDSMTRYFESVGIDGLNNGLSESENKVLFETRNIKEMIRLLFKGLKIVSASQSDQQLSLSI